MILDRFLAAPRVRQIDRVAVDAAPAVAWAAARGLDLFDIPFVRRLFALRLFPEHVAALFHHVPPAPSPRMLRIDDIVAPGSAFVRLAEEPGHEVVVGAVGRFWRPSIAFAPIDAESFAPFAEADYGKVAWALRVEPRVGGGSWITLDLRLSATDDDAWRKLVPYFGTIGPFSRAIRRGALRILRKALGEPRDSDAARVLAGDDLLPNASAARTDAITIEAPPSRVWPLLLQHAGRRGHAPGLVVRLSDAPRALVLAEPEGAEPAHRMTWAFVLDPIGDDATRLVARIRGEDGARLLGWARVAAIAPAQFVMARKQLRAIKRRAERAAHASDASARTACATASFAPPTRAAIDGAPHADEPWHGG